MDARIIPYIILCTAALITSGLTLFSGFGLGTLLMPVFAIFFPVEIAVAATGVVHLANNLFKLGLLRRHADWGVAARFAIPGALTAVGGAIILTSLSDLPVLVTYTVMSRTYQVTPVNLVIGVLIILFAFFEFLPDLEARIQLSRRHLVVGGALSGFFGGVSGHQGAFRTAVLIRCGLTKEAFIATGVVCAVIVDCSRLTVYGVTFFSQHFDRVVEAGGAGLVGAATLAAFIGAAAGARLMKKVTMTTVHRVVGVMLILLGVSLGAGLV